MLNARQTVRKWRSLYDSASAQVLQLYGPTHGAASDPRNIQHNSHLDKFREPYYSDGLKLRQERQRYRTHRKEDDKFFHEILVHTRRWRSRYSYMYSKEEWDAEVGRHALAAFGLYYNSPISQL